MTLHPRDGNAITVEQPLLRPSAANTGTSTTAVSSIRSATGHLSSVFAETVPVIVLNVTVGHWSCVVRCRPGRELRHIKGRCEMLCLAMYLDDCLSVDVSYSLALQKDTCDSESSGVGYRGNP